MGVHETSKMRPLSEESRARLVQPVEAREAREVVPEMSGRLPGGEEGHQAGREETGYSAQPQEVASGFRRIIVAAPSDPPIQPRLGVLPGCGQKDSASLAWDRVPVPGMG